MGVPEEGFRSPVFYLGGVIGLMAVGLGVAGIVRSGRTRTGRWLSIAGLVIGTLVALTLLTPVVEQMRIHARQSAAQAMTGRAHPSFVAETLDGDRIDTSLLKGQPFLLILLPTPRELESLDAVYSEYRARNPKVFAVMPELRGDMAAIPEFARRNDISVPMLVADEETLDAFRVGGFGSHVVLIDDTGTIREVVFDADYEQMFQSLLRARAAAG